jgi:prepilin-type N-terminal cleavage/methylation domain-containing protein
MIGDKMINFKFLILGFNKIKKQERGFTVVEVVISIFIFSIITMIVSGNFVDVLKLQKRGFSAQMIQEETLFVFEMMAREIRVSQIQSPNDLSCNTTNLVITHPINGITNFFLSNGVVNKTVGGTTFPLTSSKVTFTRLSFCIIGSGVDNFQPRITIIASVRPSNDYNLQFDVQTTVSSRDLREELIN